MSVDIHGFNMRAHFQTIKKSLEIVLGQVKSQISNKSRIGGLGRQGKVLPRRVSLSIRLNWQDRLMEDPKEAAETKDPRLEDRKSSLPRRSPRSPSSLIAAIGIERGKA